MAIINKTGITNGSTIQAEHITRAIDALSGGSTDTIIATGSFSGSLTGTATSASFATTASYVANASSFPYTGSARITGSLSVTGSLDVTGSLSVTGTLTGNLTGQSTLTMNLSGIGTSGNFLIPFTAPQQPGRGSMYLDISGPYLYVHNGSTWLRTSLTPAG